MIDGDNADAHAEEWGITRLITTNLGVRSSNLFGRAIFLVFPCVSHGNHTVDFFKQPRQLRNSARSACSEYRTERPFGSAFLAVHLVEVAAVAFACDGGNIGSNVESSAGHAHDPQI
jgi:hypothetical protein